MPSFPSRVAKQREAKSLCEHTHAIDSAVGSVCQANLRIHVCSLSLYLSLVLVAASSVLIDGKTLLFLLLFCY